MIRRKKDKIEWLEFEQLQDFPEVVHAVFLRHGGVSPGPFTSLNFGGGTGDDSKIITENRRIAFEILGIKTFISSKQVHGDHIEVVPTETSALECDGLMTQEEGIGLLIKHADCQAAIFYDPEKNVIANVHCGWRGSVKNIYAKMVEKLVCEYGCSRRDIRVCISPSLGPTFAEFINHKTELPEAFSPYQVKPNYFDFWEISRMQLLDMGILDKYIEIAKMCTFSERESFFSYRREKRTGRHGTVVALNR